MHCWNRECRAGAIRCRNSRRAETLKRRRSLQAFIDRDDSGASADLLSKIKLITWRGMMTKLLLAVYEAESASSSGRAEGWQMNAMMVDVSLRSHTTSNEVRLTLCCRLQGCLYLEDANSSAKLAKKTASEQAYRQQSYYGYSFEAFSTQNSPDAPFEPPNTNVQWCSVVKTNLGGVRTILGGEVDCVLPGTDAKRMDTSRFVELKTNIVIQSARDEMMFERWARACTSILAGTTNARHPLLQE